MNNRSGSKRHSSERIAALVLCVTAVQSAHSSAFGDGESDVR